jgi:hypothetical protein
MLSGVTAQPPARSRPLVLVVLDVIASIVLVAFGLVFGLVALNYAQAYNGISAVCNEGPYEGLTCNQGALGAVIIALSAIAVLAIALGFGMTIVSFIRKRYAFWWPLGAIVVLLAAFYGSAALVGQIAPAL